MVAKNLALATITATDALTSRSFGDRFADEATVLDFGADRTGVADSNAAFVAALADAMSTGRRRLRIPYGTYLIEGDGPHTTKINFINSNTAILPANNYLIKNVDADSDILFRDLSIIGDGTNKNSRFLHATSSAGNAHSIRFEKGKKSEGNLYRVAGYIPPATPGRKSKAQI